MRNRWETPKRRRTGASDAEHTVESPATADVQLSEDRPGQEDRRNSPEPERRERCCPAQRGSLHERVQIHRIQQRTRQESVDGTEAGNSVVADPLVDPGEKGVPHRVRDPFDTRYRNGPRAVAGDVAETDDGDDATRAFFCTSGCATTYYAVPEQFVGTDTDIAGLWVRELNSRELTDGTAAYYTLEIDADRLDDPMRVNPATFAAREDAVTYVDGVECPTEDDVVELPAFDRALAEQYCGQLLE